MALPPPQAPRTVFRLALPHSVETRGGLDELASALGAKLGKPVEVVIAPSYEQLSKDLLAQAVDAAWAPPFVCARVEAMGARILVRGVRRGASSYRSALLCRAGSGLTLEKLRGLSALWLDRDSTAGYLLPMAFLRSKGIDPKVAFPLQGFTGSYKEALEKVALGEADVTAIFAPPRGPNGDTTGVEDVAPELASKLQAFAFTDESPNDAVAVSMGAPAEVVARLEQALLGLADDADGRKLLELFRAERFEPAPRLGYRALYRVAIAGL